MNSAAHGQRTQLIGMAKKILVAKKADPDADISSQEAEIDQLVYSLYGLTREEIAIIEESLQQRAASREVADEATLEEQN